MRIFAPIMNRLRVNFPHGLGDCVYFAHQLPVYRRRGHEFEVGCAENKNFIFTPMHAPLTDVPEARVSWLHADPLEAADDTNYWRTNKSMFNFSLPPMPDIGPISAELWDEFCAVKINLGSQISARTMAMVDDFYRNLPRPIVLLHSVGNSSSKEKSIPDDLVVEIYRSVLDELGGTLVLLDWDNRVPRIASGQIKHMLADWKRLSVEELLAAIIRADLLIGIDSGPLHLCRFTDTPAVGLWFGSHHPAKFSLPRANQVNLTLKKNAPHGNRQTRWFYNIVEEHADQIRAAIVARTCRQILVAPRYLPASHIGNDVMMQHWITDWTRGGVSDYRSFIDRDKSFDLMLRHTARFPTPRIVETGCIRSEEDWRGAGFATYLLGAFANARGGQLDSVDIDQRKCDFAHRWTHLYGDSTHVHCMDSLHFLLARQEPIDLLYLDSWDTYVPGYAEHGLREIQAAARFLHDQSMIVYDDTSILAGKWQGKGMLGVPWLMERGWHPVHIGHQTVLVRS